MLYVFGDYTLDTQAYALSRAGALVHVRPKVFQVLAYLLAHRDRVVSKLELMEQVWPRQSVSDETLDSCIALARRAVGDSARVQAVIQTRHGYGHRFVAAVKIHGHPLLADAAPAVVLASPVPQAAAALASVPVPTDSPASRYTPHQRLLAGEQKLVTVLVCTPAHAAAWAQRLEAEVWHQARQTFFAASLEEVQRYGGTLQHLLDDGILVLFGAPVAQEDHARRAVRAALGLQQRIRKLHVDAAWPLDEACVVCQGLHTGRMLLGSLGDDGQLTYTAVGDTTQHAAWLARQAAPGTILVSDATARLVHGEVRIEACAPVPCLGPTDPGPAYQVLGLGPHCTPLLTDGVRPRSRFVGRELELATLQALLARVAGGQGQVVGIVGEPGMGKTRLLAEFWQRLGDTRVTYLEGRCVSYGQAIPYGPLCDLLRHACGCTEADSPTTITAHMQQHLQTLGMAPAEAVPFLLPLLGVPDDAAPLVGRSPQELRTQTFATLHQLLLQESQRQPLLVVVENLHWIDPTSQAYLTELVERLISIPLLLLVTFRPGYRPPWMEKSYATQLALSRLSPEDSRSIVQAVLHPTPVPEPLMQDLLTKAAGNPLFLEELAWTVREHGDLRLPPEVPDTIRAVLAARIDRLPPEAKQVLQTAAVIGTEVPLPMLQAMAEVPEEVLRRALAHLHAAEFLYETRLFPTPTWTFKHALTHEVAYGSLLQAGRRTLHARIVTVIEGLAEDRVAEQVDRLAQHAFRGEVWDKAVTYSQQAGTRAHIGAAFHEAVTSFAQALQALAHRPEDGDRRALAIDLRLMLGELLNLVGAYGRRLTLLGEAEARARTLDDRVRLGQVLTQMAHARRIAGDQNGAIAAGQQALTLAGQSGERALQVQAAYTLAQVYWAIGDFGRAAALLRRNIEAVDRAAGTLRPALRLQSQVWLVRTLSALGAFTEGRRHGEEALHLATLEGRGNLPIMAHKSLGFLYLTQGDLAPAIQVLETGRALCCTSGNKIDLPSITAGLGFASALQGRLTEGRALLEEAISEGFHTGALQGLASHLVWLSEVCRLAGHHDTAWQHTRQALALARQHAERANEARALHQLGVVQAHAVSPEVAQAEVFYQQALALAEELGMRPLVAHCHHGLGRLYGTMGQREQAHAALCSAIALYREMEMAFWLPQAESALAQVA